jgi:hypothetical protein
MTRPPPTRRLNPRAIVASVVFFQPTDAWTGGHKNAASINGGARS